MDSGRKNLAYPKSQVDAPLFNLFVPCGGLGGGSCVVILGATQYIFNIRVPKFVVFNRSLLFSSTVQIYTDAGPDGFGCTSSEAVQQGYWVALSADGSLTDAQVEAQGIYIDPSMLSFGAAINILFDWNKSPQPTDASWQNKIFVHLHWASPLYVAPLALTDDVLLLTKHDYDVKQ
jgi:hypothetical protein